MTSDVGTKSSPGNDEGIAAARAGDAGRVQAWLKEGNDPNRYDAKGWTPLLWASVRGHHDVVRALVDNGADTTIAHRESRALPVHFAGHSGDVETARILLDRVPRHVNAVWDLNGHNIFLQAVFYGHLDLAKFLVTRSPDTSITTARGLGASELAAQFQNQAMLDIVRPIDATAGAKAAYYRGYLDRISPALPEGERETQQKRDALVAAIEDGLKAAATDPASAGKTLDKVRDLVENGKVDVNGLGGPLQQPPLIVVVTGGNGFSESRDVARLRFDLANYLLEKGADPLLHEKHPMAVQTIIRAAVFNHLSILRLCAQHLAPRQLTDGINEVPLVNALTAMHDSVLRASMAGPDRFDGYLDQIRFFVSNGGRVDMEDYSGVTQRNIAERVKDPVIRKRLLAVVDGDDVRE